MTCVIGIVDGQVVIMAADSAATDEQHNLEIQRQPKIFHIQVPGKDGSYWPMLIGFAGNFRVAQIVRWAARVPQYKASKPVMHYLVKHFVPALESAVNKVMGEPAADTEAFRDCSFLVGFRGHLYTIEPNGQVLEANSRYSGIGSGAPIAMGALHAASQHGNLCTWDLLDSALQAAEALCSGVRRPFHMDYTLSIAV